MKRSVGGFYGLIDRRIPGLKWWQEIIINWVASWDNLSTVMVITTAGHQWEWDMPPDHELDRMLLEELWES